MRREAEGTVVEPGGDRGLRVQFELLRGLSEAEVFLEERDGDHGHDLAADRFGAQGGAAPCRGVVEEHGEAGVCLGGEWSDS